jgi:hypothetical protein
MLHEKPKIYVDTSVFLGLREYNEASKHRNVSKHKLILELEKIRVFAASGGKRLMNPLTKTQRDILTAFKVSEADLNGYVQRSS